MSNCEGKDKELWCVSSQTGLLVRGTNGGHHNGDETEKRADKYLFTHPIWATFKCGFKSSAVYYLVCGHLTYI